ncbi:MAG: lipid-A-disaccharide synthase [Bacteroidetes bacterium]|nr:lipid-A-disaccharide synthase [Bacteroidota bacterium]
MKYYIIAGEASGDLHGSNLIRELKKTDPDAIIRCWGGDKMQEAGGTLVKHYRDLAFMGFAEVLMNLRTIFRNLAFCKEDILQFNPDALILVDYPGFNLRIAKWAKEQTLFTNTHRKIIYYISPQVWAWKANRVKSMKKCIDKMLVILPFEKDYYKNKWDWDVEYVGHPLIEIVESEQWAVGSSQLAIDSSQLAVDSSQLPIDNSPFTIHHSPLPIHHPIAIGSPKIIALLPGSRKQEILKKLPVMLEVSKSYPEYQFIVAKAPGMEESFYDALLKDYHNVSYVSNQTYALLKQSTAALVTSGTATLETALFSVPEVVCYKGSWLSYQIGKRLVDVKYISLVNLIMDRLVVTELIQDDLTVDNLKKELHELLTNEERIRKIQNDYADLKRLLGEGGNASARSALSISRLMNIADHS